MSLIHLLGMNGCNSNTEYSKNQSYHICPRKNTDGVETLDCSSLWITVIDKWCERPKIDNEYERFTLMTTSNRNELGKYSLKKGQRHQPYRFTFSTSKTEHCLELTSIPTWWDTNRGETTSTDQASQVFPREPMKLWSVSHCCSAISPQ